MFTTLGVAFLLGGLATLIGLAAGRGGPRADYDEPITFDAHTAMAMALLTPDALDDLPTPDLHKES